MDVENSFFDGDIQEGVYVLPISGVFHNTSGVCELIKGSLQA